MDSHDPQLCREGKRLERVYVVAEPPTNYIRYELMWSYEPNVAAGEDIRILPGRPHVHWRDAALHNATTYREYMHRGGHAPATLFNNSPDLPTRWSRAHLW
jgi:hypothetical protein